ncbi:sigma-70 family RNA polymerase sigma factor [Oceaniferula marina]|nr:sigma-70 family RNA polymerase sigma factor [Oceaniferula marina]
MSPEQIEYLQLVTSHQAMLQGYIHSIAPGVEAEDVLQETNVLLWQKMNDFELGTNFKAFACKVAYFKTMESLRAQSRKKWLVYDSDIVENINDYYASGNEDRGEFQSALRRCLSKLKQKDRALVTSRYTDGRTVREIAAMQKKKEGALQQAFFRIHRGLRSCVTRQLGKSQSIS